MIETGRIAASAIEVVWTSDPLPNDALAVRKGLDVNGGGKPGHMPAPEWGSSARRFLTVGQG